MKIMIGVLGIAFVVVVTAVAVETHDEPLSSQTLTLLKVPTNPYRSGANLYYMLPGMEAPSGASLRGQAPIPDSTVFRGRLPNGWNSTNGIWEEALQDKAEIDRLLTTNHELYLRYLALHHASGFFDTSTPGNHQTFPFPQKQFRTQLKQLRELFLAAFALGAQSGNVEKQSAALADMVDDLRIWRMVMTGYGPLSSKIVAIAYLRQDFLLVSNMLADGEIRLPVRSAMMKALVTPFPLNNWKIGNGVAYGFRATARFLGKWDGAGFPAPAAFSSRPRLWRFVFWLFYRPHATQNLEARNTLKIIDIVDGPAATLAKPTDVSVYPNCFDGEMGPSCLYNWFGKGVVNVLIPAYKTYSLRAYDVAALQRIVRLAYAIRVHKMSRAAIVAFMKDHPEWSTHPVNDSPFIFDPQTHRLSVALLSRPGKEKSLSIPLWHAAIPQL